MRFPIPNQFARLDHLLALGACACFRDASDLFDLARSHFSRLQTLATFENEVANAMKVCKQNAVVTRILATGQKSDVSGQTEAKL